MLAARLAEDASVTILLLEAGRESQGLDTVKMSMGYAKFQRTATKYDVAHHVRVETKNTMAQRMTGTLLLSHLPVSTAVQ